MEPGDENLMNQQLFLGQVSAAGLLLTVSSLFYNRVFDGPGWIPAVIGAVLLSFAVGVALARTGLGRFSRAIALGIIGVLFLTLAVILPGTSFGGLSEVGTTLADSTFDGWRNTLGQTLPISSDSVESLGFVTTLAWLTGATTGVLLTRSKQSALAMIPAALACGFGELGKHGSIINPEFGASFRLSAVLTDAPFAPTPAREFGIDEFCQNCRICEDACPPEALSSQKQIVRGETKWYVDFDKCLPYFNETHGCAICIAACPWSHPDIGLNLASKLARRATRKT